MALSIGLYVTPSKEAVKTYMAAFGLELGYHVLNDDGSYYHSELMKDGEEIMSVVEAARDVRDNPVELGFTFETRGELERAFDILKENGRVRLNICELPWSPCAAQLSDRFGVSWYLTLPQHHPPEDFTP